MQIPDLKKLPGIFKTGFFIQVAPELAKGALVELLKKQDVNVSKASEWVQDNASLWKMFKPEQQAMLRNMAKKVGNVDWLTAEWAIDAIREDLPAVASLFVGWPKANNWLKRQLEHIKKEIEVETKA